MASLSPYSIAKLYTLSQINQKIAFWDEQLEGATVRSYDKDTTQGRQKVESAELDKIESTLQAYLKAKEIITGQSGPNISSATFRSTGRGF